MKHTLSAWLVWTCSGLLLGIAFGLGFAIAFIVRNEYGTHGMSWLMTDALAQKTWRGARLGLLWGAVAGVGYLILVRPLGLAMARWLRARTARIELIDRDRFGAFAAALAISFLLLAGGLYVLNEYFIPWQYSRRWWVLNVGWSVGSVVVFFVLYRVALFFRFDGNLVRRLRNITFAKAGIIGVLVAALQLYSGATRPHPGPQAQNVFLLTVDTTRADHLSCYGYPRPTTPQIDELSAAGLLYENAFSHAAVTSASFACIMTGFRPRETGTYGNSPVHLRMNTLAEYFRNAGYRTAAVVSNYVLHRGKNYEYGFDHYDDQMDDRELVRNIPERIGANTTNAAMSWLRENAGDDRPIFMWVHYQDPHGPYTPPREYQSMFLDASARGRELRVNDDVSGSGGIPSYQKLDHHRDYGYYVAQYDAEMRYFDDSFADLVEGLRELGLWNESLRVFTSDHGEGMGEHDYYFAHGDVLWPGQIHVPLVLWAPRIRTGLRSDTVVQLADIAPTVLRYAGIPTKLDLPGRDLLADELEDAVVLSETFHDDNYKCSLLSREMQVLYDKFNDDYRAYDWKAGNFVEEIEVVDSEASRRFVELSEGLAILRNVRARPGRTGTTQGGLSAEEMEKLKSLGYVN